MCISYFPPLDFRLSDFEDISSQLLYQPLKRQTHVAAETVLDVRIDQSKRYLHDIITSFDL